MLKVCVAAIWSSKFVKLKRFIDWRSKLRHYEEVRYRRGFHRHIHKKCGGKQHVRRRLVAMNGANTAKQKGCVRVLGVDPAAAGPTGYGIVEESRRGYKLLHYGAHRVGAKQQKEIPGAVLHEVHDLMCRLIVEYEPDVMALESVFTALNMRTALRLAEVRGVILLAAAQHGLKVHSYAPREVKASVAGHGHAEKRQIQLMVRALLAMTETPEPADAADALAVALCHLQAERMQHKFALPKPPVNRVQSAMKIATPQNSAIALNSLNSWNGATRDRSRRIITTR